MRMREYIQRHAELLGLAAHPPPSEPSDTYHPSGAGSTPNKRARSPTPEPWTPGRAQERSKRRRVVRTGGAGANASFLDAIGELEEPGERDRSGESVVIMHGFDGTGELRTWFKYEPKVLKRALCGKDVVEVVAETETETFVFAPEASEAPKPEAEGDAAKGDGKANEVSGGGSGPVPDAKPEHAEDGAPTREQEGEAKADLAPEGAAPTDPTSPPSPSPPPRTYTISLVAASSGERSVLARAVRADALTFDDDGVGVLGEAEEGESVRKGWKMEVRRWRYAKVNDV